MGLKHAFKSLKTDPTDPTIIGATKWNDDHYYVDGAGAPIGNVGAVLLAGAAGALTHLNSVAAGQVLTSAGVGALPVWAAAATVPAALTVNTLTFNVANPDVVLSRSAANKLLLGGASFAMLQFGGTTNAFPALKAEAGALHIRRADDSGLADLFMNNVASNAAVILNDAAAPIYWSGRMILETPSDGTLKLSNFARNDFSLLQFGGTTAAFPALKRSGTTLQVKLADDSAFAPIAIGNTVSAAAAAPSTHKVAISIGGVAYFLLASNV
jgi:hypothetical protein